MKLQARLSRIERNRDDLLDRVDALDPRVLRARVRPDKWSIQEIIEHLVIAEEDVLVDVANLERLPVRARGLRNRILYVVVMFILKHRIPVRAPSQAMLPTGRVPLTELRRRWEANHRRLRQYVEPLDMIAARRAIFRHPVTGPLTVDQALRMMDVHLDRHIRQIRRLERALL